MGDLQASGSGMAVTSAGGADDIARRLQALETKLERTSSILEEFDRRREVVDQLGEDLMPMATGAMKTLISKLGDLEQNGTLGVLQEALAVVERIPLSLSREDVELLGANLVHLLLTARNLTQPEMLDLADRASTALRDPSSVRPLGAVGLLGALRDPEVKRGVGVLVEVLRALGKAPPGEAE